MSRFTIGLVGCGVVADWHVDWGYAHLTDLVRLAAVCDTRLERAEALAARTGARAYNRLEDLLADPAIDGVDICLPHHLHAPAALQALAAGKHVLVEKPLATTVENGERMVGAAAERGLTLCVTEQYPFSMPFQRARDLIQSGEIGKLVTIRTHRVGYLGGVWMRDGWRQNASIAGGGMLLDQGCHYTSIARMLAGEVEAVAAFTSSNREDWNGDDTATLILRFRGGLIGEALYCWATKTSNVGAECYVYGERGHLRVNSGAPALVLYRPDLPDGRQVIVDQPEHGKLFARMIEDFALAALGERQPTMPGTEGLADLRVVMAAYRSARSGQVELV
ncbi:MAG: Gfo/Idh/MocA family oxidoreductase [Chloroflexi bacterium]|nr:Gfo/Idh/MocA family oxidoreductase [Chloroflexota bacterium]